MAAGAPSVRSRAAREAGVRAATPSRRLRPDGELAYAELLQIAGESGLNMSSVLAWAARAEEAGLVEQRTGISGHGRVLRLTDAGTQIARNNRRRFHRRERWQGAPDDVA